MFDALYLRRAESKSAPSATPQNQRSPAKRSKATRLQGEKDCNNEKAEGRKIGKAWQKLSKL
ncbi:hypothetical protein BKN38_01000 [Helicobacter sp. CLO-3]|nr:hypothetical protein BA723_06595 [Helicobacter sp. CLO-3]OHU85627.1 hypothetical protein BKN38_01000 [Helicobacter sp. CLO-3]